MKLFVNDTDGTEEKSEGKRALRIVSVAAAFLVTILAAVCAGAGLALWDTGYSVNTIWAMAREDDPPIESGISEDVTGLSGGPSSPDEDSSYDGSYTGSDEASHTEADEDGIREDPDKEDPDKEDAEDTIIAPELAGIESLTRAGREDETVIISGTINNSVNSPNFVDPDKDYPLTSSIVDDQYFDDALFIGDSRMQGFGMSSGTKATFYTAVGFQLYNYETAKIVQTANGKVPIFDGIPYDAFTKIYIKVGLNEMGWANEEKFEELYAEFIEKLREKEPHAIIYVHALLPVTASKSETDPAHSNQKIAARNEALKEFAKKKKCYFIDIASVVSDETGALKSEMTTDGIHLVSKYMSVWLDYLKTHAILVR